MKETDGLITGGRTLSPVWYFDSCRGHKYRMKVKFIDQLFIVLMSPTGRKGKTAPPAGGYERHTFLPPIRPSDRGCCMSDHMHVEKGNHAEIIS